MRKHVIGLGLSVLALTLYMATSSGAAAKGGWTLGFSTFIGLFILVAKAPRVRAVLTACPVATDGVMTIAAFFVFNMLFQGVTATPAAIVFGLLVSSATSLSAIWRQKRGRFHLKTARA